MKSEGLILLGAGVLALIYFGSLGVAANVIQAYIQSVDFSGITSGQIVLMIQNPSNTAIRLNSMAGTISANGTIIGNISNFQGGVSIPANQQTPVTINFNLSLSGLIGDLYGILTRPTGTNNVDFVVSGNANINAGMIVPLTIEQTIAV